MKIVKKTLIQDNTNYYDITVNNHHNFVLANGAVAHNCGTGVGFSVERQEVVKLPVVAEDFYPSDTTIIVPDSKLGWASSFRELIAMLYSGRIPKWDLSRLRPAGARLKTFGGRSSGPAPLDELFRFAVEIFRNAAGRRLTSIECHDLMCKVGDIVVVGGVRRSALISLSNLSDERMRHAKSGKWWENNVQRALANNSVAYTERPEMEIFMREWLSLVESKSGERGIFNVDAAQKHASKNGRRDGSLVRGTNPCSEILLRSKQFCNLSEVVVRANDDFESLARKVRIATILGTLQSSLTNFRYLSKEWENNTKEEALLGVSLTGIMDNELLCGKKSKKDMDLSAFLESLKDVCIKENKQWAKTIGINQSAAITCVKPSGCTTLDTSVKTEYGVKTMAELFADLTDINIFECHPGTWIEPKKAIRVYDENNDLQPVTRLFVNGLAEVYEVKMADGNVYKFTGNHKLKTINGWKRVDQLTEDDDIIEF